MMHGLDDPLIGIELEALESNNIPESADLGSFSDRLREDEDIHETLHFRPVGFFDVVQRVIDDLKSRDVVDRVVGLVVAGGVQNDAEHVASLARVARCLQKGLASERFRGALFLHDYIYICPGPLIAGRRETSSLIGRLPS